MVANLSAQAHSLKEAAHKIFLETFSQTKTHFYRTNPSWKRHARSLLAFWTWAHPWEQRESLSSKKRMSLSTVSLILMTKLLWSQKQSLVFPILQIVWAPTLAWGNRTHLWQSPASRTGQPPGKLLLSGRFLCYHVATHLFTCWTDIHWMLTLCQPLSFTPGWRTD